MSRLVGNGLNLDNQRITNLGDASAATDAVTKQQLDNAVAGLAWKQPVRAASTGNGTLASAYANGQTLDGVTLATGDRILLKDQSTGAENGIYTVNASGAPTRAVDANADAELQSATVFVVQGTTNADKAFTQTANSPTVGTTALVWAQVGGGTAYTAGNGLSLTAGAFAVVPKSGGGLSVDGTGVFIDSAYSGLAKRYAAAIGDGSTTSIMVTHNLGTRDVTVTIYDAATYEEIIADVTHATTNTLTVVFATAPASSAYRVVVVG